MPPKPKIVLRADGNSAIGLGHVYRLIALYHMLQDEFDCVFITSENSTIDIIPIDIKLIIIPLKITTSEEVTWFTENINITDIIVLDGYQFDSEFQFRLKSKGYKFAYIDDLAKYHMYADLVINHAPNSIDFYYEGEKYCKYALGLEYVILRPKFLEEAIHIHNSTIGNHAFVCFGGSDFFNLNYKVAKILLKIDEIESINIVVGNAGTSNYLLRLTKGNSKIIVHNKLSEEEVIDVMKSCSFAIAPTSTILLELMAIGIPVLIGYYANNQKDFYDYLKINNCYKGVGNFRSISNTKLELEIKKFLSNGMYKNAIIQKKIQGNSKQKIVSLFHNLI